MIGLKLLDK